MPSLLDARRTAAALVAVALSAALIAFAFIVSDSYTTGMQADARLSLGGADAVVVPARPSEGGGPLDDAVIARLSDLDGVASVRGEHMDILRLDLPEQLTRAVGSAVLAQDVPALSERTTLTAGRLPQGPGEVAIDTTLAKQQELGVGDVIRLKNNDDGDIRIYAERAVDYEHGVTDDQLALHVYSAIASATGLFSRLDEALGR